MQERPKAREWPVLGRSNGHTWIKPDWLFVEACRDCGTTRRGDDANRPCKGKVAIEFRET